MTNIRKFLFEDEPVVGVTTPSDYKYLKILRFSLSIINAWPHREVGEEESRLVSWTIRGINLFIWLFGIFGGSTFIYLHNSQLSFFEMGHVYLCVLIPFVNISKLITLGCSANYRSVAKDYLRKIHLFYYKDHSEFAMETHKKVHFISHLFTLCLFGQMVLGLIFFNVIPMYSNYASGKFKPGGLGNRTFEHSLYLPYPFNVSTNVNGYIVALILHWIFAWFSSTWFCMMDCFLSLIVFQIWGHFKILINDLNSFQRPSSKTTITLKNVSVGSEMFSESELVNVGQKLKECVDYHRYIISYTNRMSNVFGVSLFVYYLFHQTSGCLMLLECSQMTAEALMRYLPLTIILFQQLIQISVIFELLGSESDKLKHAVYGLPWEFMDTKNRKVVHIFLMNAQEPVHVKALGVANVGVNTMAAILKTSVSFFTFLRSI